MASVFPDGSCAGLIPFFQLPVRRVRSAMENERIADRSKYRPVVAVASSTAPGVLDTIMPVGMILKKGYDKNYISGEVGKLVNGTFFLASESINLIVACSVVSYPVNAD